MLHIGVIMAAGMGTRFGYKTDLIPKGFIPFKGKPMVLRSIEVLLDCGNRWIILVTSYHSIEIFTARSENCASMGEMRLAIDLIKRTLIG